MGFSSPPPAFLFILGIGLVGCEGRCSCAPTEDERREQFLEFGMPGVPRLGNFRRLDRFGSLRNCIFKNRFGEIQSDFSVFLDLSLYHVFS